jgi:hypothetical protein
LREQAALRVALREQLQAALREQLQAALREQLQAALRVALREREVSQGASQEVEEGQPHV